MDSAASATAGLESVLRVVAADGAASDLVLVEPATRPSAVLLWLPALGVAARHYLPFARALAAGGIAVGLHEWRGAGSSDRRAGWRQNWGYRELLLADVPASREVLAARFAGLPAWLGGHSLGGQLAVLAAALAPERVAGLVLVASGSPYWRQFRHRVLVRLAYAVVPAIAMLAGHFPGRMLGFGGREARGVMRDWARSGRSGRYAPDGIADNLEARLARLVVPVRAIGFADDWLGPRASLDGLLRQLPGAAASVSWLAKDDLGGVAADHFGWLKAPEGVVTALTKKGFGFKAL